jgi:hypothetical protein
MISCPAGDEDSDQARHRCAPTCAPAAAAPRASTPAAVASTPPALPAAAFWAARAAWAAAAAARSPRPSAVPVPWPAAAWPPCPRACLLGGLACRAVLPTTLAQHGALSCAAVCILGQSSLLSSLPQSCLPGSLACCDLSTLAGCCCAARAPATARRCRPLRHHCCTEIMYLLSPTVISLQFRPLSLPASHSLRRLLEQGAQLPACRHVCWLCILCQRSSACRTAVVYRQHKLKKQFAWILPSCIPVCATGRWRLHWSGGCCSHMGPWRATSN